MKIPTDHQKYGIVIDSGSSGSRIQIYRWEDQEYTKKSNKDKKVLSSPPKIVQEKGWTYKITPGISTFGEPNKVKKIWTDHYSELMKFAEGIIPAEKHSETPVYVLATAGMRLLPPKKQKKILKETCSSLKKNTKFYIPNCKDFVQIIDGETEGIYGWLGLNYLMGQFNEYDASKEEHESIGFMDMGGASTQIAFVPSSLEEIKKHDDDLSKVTLRNVDGQTQKWSVFVETWLGFGANEARRRYLKQLINLSLTNPILGTEINDPCLPKGASIKYDNDGTTYDIQGLGNYEMCIKEIYPLLMKNVPCKDTPCLFNGIHGPKLNFDKDKFIGISEYWYTANDVFQTGGEYNFHIFNERVKEYCESDWSLILSNSEKGQYSNLDPEKFLKDACFKASWVINVLHDGFELPRLGLDVSEDTNASQEKEMKKLKNTHVPFKSANSVNGDELSWTLGKILLFASSQITGDSKKDMNIGIYPSEISGKEFVPGGIIGSSEHDSDDDDDDHGVGFGHIIYSIIFIFLLFFFIYHFGRSHLNKYVFKSRRFHIPKPFKQQVSKAVSKIPGLNKYFKNIIPYNSLSEQDTMNIHLEEGIMPSASTSPTQSPNLAGLRTRSNINLADPNDLSDDYSNPSRNFGFLNKPFVVPKKTPSGFYYSNNNSRDSLHRVSSNSSMSNKLRNVD